MTFLGAARSDGAVSGRRAETWLRQWGLPGWRRRARPPWDLEGHCPAGGRPVRPVCGGSGAGGAQCVESGGPGPAWPSAQGQGCEQLSLAAGKGVRRPWASLPRRTTASAAHRPPGFQLPLHVGLLNPAFPPPAEPEGLGVALTLLGAALLDRKGRAQETAGCLTGRCLCPLCPLSRAGAEGLAQGWI